MQAPPPSIVRRSRHLGEAAVALLLVVVSVLLLPRQASAFVLPKRLAAEVLALLSLACLWPALGARSWSEVLRRPAALRALAPLTLVVAATLAWSEHTAITVDAVLSFVIGAACLVVWSEGFERRELDRLFTLLAGLGVLQAALAVCQYHDWFDPLVFEQTWGVRRGITALVGAPGDLGAYLLLPLLWVQARWPDQTSRRGRWHLVAASVVLVYGLAVTGTLTAIGAAVASSLVLWWRSRHRRRILGTVALVVAFGGLAMLASSPLRNQVEDKVAAAAAADLNRLLTGRVDGWRVAGAMLRERPLGGVGWGAYRAEFGPTKLSLAQEAVEFYPEHVFPTFQNAHNELLEVAAESGGLGILALFWVLLETVRAGRRIREPRDRALAWSGLLTIALVSVAYFPFRLAVTAYPFLLFLAWTFRVSADAGADSA